MLRKYAYARGLKKLTKNHKKDFLSSVISANLESDQHNMLIEEEKFILESANMPFPNVEEYSILEKVDLIDYGNYYGRNKKRRSLLCRS